MDKRFDHRDLPDTSVHSVWPFEHIHPLDVESLAQVLASVAEFLADPTTPTGLGTILGRYFGADDSAADEIGRAIADEWSLTAWAYIDGGRALRPSRLNYAGWCDWCNERWCTRQRCIDRHANSQWEVCDLCGGRGMDEVDVECRCVIGLVETTPIQTRFS